MIGGLLHDIWNLTIGIGGAMVGGAMLAAWCTEDQDDGWVEAPEPRDVSPSWLARNAAYRIDPLLARTVRVKEEAQP